MEVFRLLFWNMAPEPRRIQILMTLSRTGHSQYRGLQYSAADALQASIWKYFPRYPLS